MTDEGENDTNDHNYIVEFYAAGTSVKVTAFDPATLREVSIVGTTRASRQHLAELAVRKLNYMKEKDKEK
jgi:hypothetical protein